MIIIRIGANKIGSENRFRITNLPKYSIEDNMNTIAIYLSKDPYSDVNRFSKGVNIK